MLKRSGRRPIRGQTLVETALILPIFLMIVVGIIVIGIGLFYQQQVTTAAREAARYAAVHSGSSREPVCGQLPHSLNNAEPCADRPDAGWPAMTAHARQFATALDASQLYISACWSGYRDASNSAIYDQGPLWANDGVTPNDWGDCTLTTSDIEPITEFGDLSCPVDPAETTDTASNLAVSNRELGVATNRVVIYACYNWSPPMAGFLAIPQNWTFRAVVSEGLQHQR